MSIGTPIKATARKRGRKAEHYKTSWDEPIYGLARRPSDGRWRIIGTDITYTEPDERLAVHRFRMWQSKQAVETVELPVGPTTLEKLSAPLAKAMTQDVRVNFPRDHREQVTVSRVVFGDEVWPWLRQMILEHPLVVAEKTGIVEIGYLAAIPKPKPSPTLTEVGKLYLDHAKISPNWRAKCKQFWKEFTDAVDVATLRNLTQEHLVEYGDMIHDAAQTPTYARQRFGAIKAIINYPTKRGKWAEDAKRALAFCGVLVPPKKSATDPQPISPDDFKALYHAADDQMKAALLLGLNCCMYGGEVATLNWSDLDLDKGTLVTARNKTKIVRIAVLWPEVIAALQTLPRKGDALFVTEAGTQADYLSIYRAFKSTRKAAGLPTIQFAQIRDGSYTSAVEAGTDLNTCKLLAGHATGIADHYIKRGALMVANACAAIHKAYAIEKINTKG